MWPVIEMIIHWLCMYRRAVTSYQVGEFMLDIKWCAFLGMSFLQGAQGEMGKNFKSEHQLGMQKYGDLLLIPALLCWSDWFITKKEGFKVDLEGWKIFVVLKRNQEEREEKSLDSGFIVDICLASFHSATDVWETLLISIRQAIISCKIMINSGWDTLSLILWIPVLSNSKYWVVSSWMKGCEALWSSSFLTAPSQRNTVKTGWT
jgi:hypothetical protein